MKVWKSPVLYFGILLVIAVAGLLAAPFIVDWNGYRSDIEGNIRRLTGRDVTIEGNISARLFPWPRLTIDDLRIANPQGMEDGEFVRVGQTVIHMSLAGLMSGRITVNSIEIDRPQVTLERRDAAAANWTFAPGIDVARSEFLDRIALDQIRITHGDLRFVDRRRGETHELTDIDAALSSSTIAGPWRLRALDGRNSVARYKGHDVDIAVTTSVWTEEEPLRIGLRVSQPDNAGLVFSFDGHLAEGRAEGQVRLFPGETPEGKTDTEGQFRPLTFSSQVVADFDRVAFDRIEIAPANIADGGTLMSGAGSLTLGQHVSADLDLSAMSLDLDEFLGAGARTLLREGGVLSLAGGLLDLMPPDVSLTSALRVTSLTIAGERLENAALVMDADNNAIRLKELSTSLPGRSRVLYEGVFFPGKAGAEVAGSLALETGDLRQLVGWIWPETKPTIERFWAGSRGQFKLQTELGMTPSRLRFSKADYELDGQRGAGDFTVTWGGRTAVDMRLDADALDVDSLAGDGIAQFKQGVLNLAGLAGLLVPHEGSADVKAAVRAKALQLNGVTASDVVLDLNAGVTGLDLRSLEIGSVGGARLKASGLILGSAAGPDGSITIDVNASDPRELLRLAGLIKGDVDPAWAADLGATAVKGSVIVRPRAGQTDAAIDVSGTVGEIGLAASGRIAGTGDGTAPRISGSGEITTPSSARLAALAGFAPVKQDQLPARFVATFDGTMDDGFQADLQLSAYGGQHNYNGRINPMAPALGLDGKLALRATDVAPLVEAMGLPVATAPQGLLVADATIKSADGAITSGDLGGRLGEAAFSGSVGIGPGASVKADLETGPLALTDLLAAGFLDWNGAKPSRESGFAAAWPHGLTGEIWLTPSRLLIHDHLVADGALVGLVAKPDELHFTLRHKDATGRDTKFEIVAAGSDGARTVTGTLALPVNLATDLADSAGGQVAQGTGTINLNVTGKGRSPAGVIAGLAGQGNYHVDGLQIAGLDPAAFLTAVDAAKDGAALTAAFEKLRKGNALSFGAVSGAITLADGEIRFAPFSAATPAANVAVTVMGELALDAIDADIGVSFPGRAGLPGLSIAYAGVPSSLVRSEDVAEISTKLGVTIMQEGIDELERLQKEQQRLALEEERLRKEDEIKLQAYYAQRDELLLRRRELRVHAQMRAYESERLRQKIEADREANAAISKAELQLRLRELKTLRQQARLTPPVAPAPPPKPRTRSEVLPETAKPAPVVVRPKKMTRRPGPVILVQPKGAPVVISPPPSGSPSQ